MPDSTQDTLRHIFTVREHLDEILANLVRRGILHDASKLEDPEREGYDRLTTRLKDVTYGSEEYRAALDEAAETIAHHYAHNRHHPEHFPNGIADMTMLDLLEMLADWKAASLRTKGGSLAQSLPHNQQRWGIPDNLYLTLCATAAELGWVSQGWAAGERGRVLEAQRAIMATRAPGRVETEGWRCMHTTCKDSPRLLFYSKVNPLFVLGLCGYHRSHESAVRALFGKDRHTVVYLCDYEDCADLARYQIDRFYFDGDLRDSDGHACADHLGPVLAEDYEDERIRLEVIDQEWPQ